jgi:aerobic carbon-monoxide dehydrogenase medium subunit
MMQTVDFHFPTTVDDAVQLLAHDHDALCLAGGQTLVAMINAKLAEPTALVSLRRVDEMRTIEFESDGAVLIGAMVPHSRVAAEPRLNGSHGVLRDAAQVIAHPAVRNLGTLGGSLCHADPNSDYPAAVVAAGAEIEIAGARGRRRVPAAEFFVDFLTTVLEPGELVTRIRVPRLAAGSVGIYEKFSRVDGDYATVSVALIIGMADGQCTDIGLALGACGSTPIRVREAEEVLQNSALDDGDIDRACRILVDACDPMDDVRGSAEYRRSLIGPIVKRAVARARKQLG